MVALESQYPLVDLRRAAFVESEWTYLHQGCFVENITRQMERAFGEQNDKPVVNGAT